MDTLELFGLMSFNLKKEIGQSIYKVKHLIKKQVVIEKKVGEYKRALDRH